MTNITIPQAEYEATAEQDKTIAELSARIASIADIAHSGGLANLTAEDALILIRRLTLDYWDKSGTGAEMTSRVEQAIAKAKQVKA